MIAIRIHQANPSRPAEAIAAIPRSRGVVGRSRRAGPSPPDPRAPLPRQSRNSEAAIPTIAAALIRLGTVGHACLPSSEQNGHLANAVLLERGVCARVTPRKK